MLDSMAITKIQSIVLVAVIIIAGVAGSVAFLFLTEDVQNDDSIKIGVCADLNMLAGESTWEGVVLAAEQINAEGGILGRQVEVIGADSDSTTGDVVVETTALTRLITVDKVDFIISYAGSVLIYQDISAEHEKILLSMGALTNELTQRVEDNYQKYKYFFRTGPNATHALLGMSDCVDTLREYSGFNKVAILTQDLTVLTDFMEVFADYISEVHGFEIVYHNKFPSGTLDFSSYLSAIESSGAEILVPWIVGEEGIILVKDWHNRQSPFVIWGVNSFISEVDAWDYTDGKSEYTTNVGFAVTSGYPLTSETVLMREAYIERWGEIPFSSAALAYDTLRFILFDAIERAQTTETEAVIEALEETKIETSLARNFIFTSSHDTMGGENINNPDEDFMVVMLFQWQDGIQLPMYPMNIKEEAGATYIFPPWPGPWDEIQ